MSDFVSLQTALSGLRAAQTQMTVAGQNVANTSTAGYTREVVNLTASPPYQTVAGWMGSGVEVTSITRARDAFLDASVRTTSNLQAGSQATANLLQQAEQILGEPSQGISAPLNALFSAFESAANNPSDSSARATVMAALNDLTTRIRQVASGWNTLADQTQQDITAKVATVNSQLAQVASLNKDIAAASGSGIPNSLLDQRDRLLDQLASEVGATSVTDPDGSVRVELGSTSLVDGISVNSLTFNANNTITSAQGGAVVAGGAVGGEQSVLVNNLPALQAKLNTFTQDLATALNAQHAAGFTPAGTSGGPLLTYAPGDAALTVTVAVTDPSQLALSDAAGPPFPVNNGVNAQNLADLQTALAATGGTATLAGSVRNLATGLGVATAASVQTANNQQATLQAMQSTRTGNTGVSIDEEMTNLMEAQRSYQASARVMTTVDATLNTLINSTGLVGR